MVDDIIVWWIADGMFDVMPNASNTQRVRDAIGGRDTTAERAVIAVQGPGGPGAASKPSPPRPPPWPASPWPRSPGRGHPARWPAPGTPERTASSAPFRPTWPPSFWQALLDEGVVPAGLGARDTLRLEAGLPLHGQDLGPGITPLQAGLGWVVGWDKGDFRGRAPLEREREAGPARRLRGLVADGRQPPRHDDAVLRRRRRGWAR